MVALQNSQLFCHLSADDQQVLRAAAQERTFSKGSEIFKEGDTGKEMYVVQSGKVRISKVVRDVEKTLVDLGAGEFFGEMAILNDRPRSATATVTEDAELLVVGPEGGFHPDELAVASRRRRLGDTILRVETAAIAAVSVMLTCG